MGDVHMMDDTPMSRPSCTTASAETFFSDMYTMASKAAVSGDTDSTSRSAHPRLPTVLPASAPNSSACSSRNLHVLKLADSILCHGVAQLYGEAHWKEHTKEVRRCLASMATGRPACYQVPNLHYQLLQHSKHHLWQNTQYLANQSSSYASKIPYDTTELSALRTDVNPGRPLACED